MAGQQIDISKHSTKVSIIGDILLSLLCFLSLSPVSAQERHGMFWNYTVDDGLPSNEVYHIHQDAKGYIWFATANGVSRFNGYEFQNYSVEEGILDADIFQIVEDSSGTLYLYSISGRIYEGNENGFKVYRHQDAIDSIIKANFDFNVWVEDVTNGFLKIDANNNLHLIRPTCHFQFSTDRSISFNNEESIYHTLVDDGSLFIYKYRYAGRDTLNNISDSLESQEKVLPLKIKADREHYLRLPIDVNYKFLKTKHRKHSIQKWRYIKIHDRLYLISCYGSLYFFSPDSVVHVESGITSAEVLHILPDSSLMIGFLANKGLQYFSHYKDAMGGHQVSFLNEVSVSYIYLDRNNILWISTINEGVFCVPYDLLKTKNKISKGVKLNIKHIEIDNNLGLYLSTNNEDIYFMHLIDHSPKRIYSGLRIKDMKYDADRKTLWFTDGTLSEIKNEKVSKYWGRGTFRRDLDKTKWTLNQNVMIGLNQFYIAKDHIWLAEPGSITLFDTEKKKIIQKKYLTYNNTALRINTIYQQEDSLYWLGTEHGVFTFNIDTISESSDSILSQKVAVYYINKSPAGTFFGTKGRGVYHYYNSKTQVIDRDDGLSSNIIESIMTLDSNELWVGTAAGVNRIIFKSPKDYQIHYYSVATGLPSNTINDLEYSNGKVYVATPEGLGIIDPEEEVKARPIQPLISEVLVNNQSYEIEALSDLGSTERNLIIKYDCLDYKQMGDILYRYRMKEGDAWNETNERAVNLLRLPPGDYHFEVQARGADRTWSESETVHFSIAPPFWKQYWFWWVISLTVIALVYTYTRSRFREVQRQAALQQKVSQLERKALRAQMNPHFIFNVLHSIQGYISEGDTSNATRYVSKFARLIRASLNHTRMTKIPLEEEIQNLKEYLDLENMRMDGQLSYQFHIPEDLDPYDYDIPPMLIQPFLENSIKHGIAPKGAGHIDVHIRRMELHLKIEIIDDGIGIEQSLKQKSENSDRTSLGMNIARERLSVLEGQELEEHVQVEELKDGEGQIDGTKVTLLIKVEPLD